jgi:hypothetical protein
MRRLTPTKTPVAFIITPIWVSYVVGANAP